ncbi:putative HTH-type transcriptional regulator YybR [Defluviimonas aquaemixtae]|uniref:Putative HTH-type transcriptional regulator YybR n=1 Tax=Albidovulum aquaemixtae TaxID=1542388 RepID=A0A2R8BL38_9RHOB|nr:helix-turn-helix domain-containing protein [Defluviimonas aquaemixtae]SPH24150.1 putative HTH-type transcriptional regulator YybR [Defluviimonas aquaemixtae]
MKTQPYGMICPITHACEILEPRWTIPILTELWAGSTRFNDLRRGIGSISPALLSKRLKELEEFGLVERIEDRATGNVDYIRTQMAIDLEPALNELAMWAQRHVTAEIALRNANLSSLIRCMPRIFAAEELPKRRIVLQFHFSDDLEYDTIWAVIQPGKPVEVCTSIPGFDVDLFVETSVKSMTALLLGRTNIAREVGADRLFLSGDALLERTMPRWLRICEYQPEQGAALLSPETSGEHAGPVTH